MIDNLPKDQLEELGRFHGSRPHQILIDAVRARLVAQLAGFLQGEWNEVRIREIHSLGRAYLQTLTDLRLDTIDLVMLSQDAVSQFESLLPTRVDHAARMRQESDSTL